MIEERISKKVRPGIRSLCIDENTWKQARELALKEERSISSLMRSVIKKMYSSFQNEIGKSNKSVIGSLAVKKVSKSLTS